MSKKDLNVKIGVLAVAALLAVGAHAAPVVVTKGSNAGYLYFPGSGSGSGVAPGGAGGTVDKVQTAPTVCMLGSGVVPIPAGFTTGFIQVILVAGGEGGALGGVPGLPGSSTTLTHSGGTLTAAGTSAKGGRSIDCSGGGCGKNGGAGGYGGRGGDGENGTTAGGNGGSNAPYGSPEGGRGGSGSVPGRDGTGALTPSTPAYIQCPGTPTEGLGAGGTGGIGLGGTSGKGGDAGAVVANVIRYTAGALTVTVGPGGNSGGSPATNGKPGVVALRFLAD